MDRDPGAEGQPSVGWAAAYVRARYREGRLLSDAIVAQLPDVPRGDSLADEWRLRVDSTARLLAYLTTMRRPLTIVDLGCGNGWLSHRMAAELGDGCRVAGVDFSGVELEQARRVFGAQTNLSFSRGDFLDGALPVDRPDVVVLASTIQYVPDPRALIETLFDSMAASGEVHVLDSPIYQPHEVAEARDRSRRHFESIGVSEMVEAYRHHHWGAFAELPYEVLYQPDDRVNVIARRVLRRARSPFPWLRFRTRPR